MKRSEVATDLARHLFEAEAAIETAYGKLGALAQALPEARVRAGMSATVGQPAFAAVMAAMAGQVESRSAIITVHEELARVKAVSPYRAVAIGGGQKTPGDTERPTPIGRLAVVR